MGLSLRDQIRLVSQHPDLPKNPEAQELYRQLQGMLESNPLLGFEPHSPPQRAFVEAMTRIVAAFAGNRFGKSTALVVCALRECLSREVLPPVLKGTKRFDPPANVWIFLPTEDKLFEAGGFRDVFLKWTPQHELKGGSWAKAFNGSRLTLDFKNGSTIAFKTYKQDATDLGGAALHLVGYDEPPPRQHREEGRMRTADYGGYEMFAMTPLKANTGYIRKVIWKKREAPNITVVKGSIHDNPTLDKETVQEILGDLTDLWRRAREFGDFVDVGGLIYPEFERCVLDKAPDPEDIRRQHIVCSIDPGIRNAGIVWVGFDHRNVATVFDELLLQDRTTADYAKAIKQVNARWGLKRVMYVGDPAIRERSKTQRETVQSALQKEGLSVLPGQNDVEAGIDQLRARMANGRFFVSPDCRGLRDEADDYAAKEPEEGRDDSHLEPIKGGDHRLDALRYGVMERFYDALSESRQVNRGLGWDPASGMSPPKQLLLTSPERDYGPLGSCS